MSLPALRRPKCIESANSEEKANTSTKVKYVLVTLKEARKELVITSDSYHGIVSEEDKYRCVFCQCEMEAQDSYKESHKKCVFHKITLKRYPHIDEFSENLIRKLPFADFYCSICHVVVKESFLNRHIYTEVHKTELSRATIRSENYF